ncbi:hypothetical protein BRADI_4g30667v3, partial [Brachypodium distachyon]
WWCWRSWLWFRLSIRVRFSIWIGRRFISGFRCNFRWRLLCRRIRLWSRARPRIWIWSGFWLGPWTRLWLWFRLW